MSDAESLDSAHTSFSFFQSINDQEQWYDAWSDELLTTYYALIDHCQSNGLPFLETCTFADFLDFAFRLSSKRPPTF